MTQRPLALPTPEHFDLGRFVTDTACKHDIEACVLAVESICLTISKIFSAGPYEL